MNLNKRKVFVIAIAMALIAILSFSTLAWFNATDSITNDFKVADSESDGDDIPDFTVDVFETGDPENDGKEYLDILPGTVLDKDPTVKNTGAYDEYVRVVVTLSDAASWVSASMKYDLTGENDDLTILEEMVDLNANWIRYDNPVRDMDGDTITYVYYYNGVVDAGATTSPVFETVTIPYQLQKEDMRYGGGSNFTITVKADAIQSQNIIPEGATIVGNNAYTAFSLANWAAGANYPQP